MVRFWLLSQKCSDGSRLRENKTWNLLGDMTSLYIEEAGLAHMLRELPVANTEIRKDFSQVQTGTSLWGFLLSPSASSMTSVQGSPVPFFQAAYAARRWPLVLYS